MKYNQMMFKQLPDGKLPIIHIEKFEDVLKFAREMDKMGLTWCDSRSYLDERILKENYDNYETNFCFSPSKGEYSGLRYFSDSPRYTIFEYKECFINKPKFVEVEDVLL